MKGRRLSLALIMVVGLVASGAIISGRAQGLFGSPDVRTPAVSENLRNPAFPDAYKLNPQPPEISVPRVAPDHLTHPCGGMYAEPPFLGVSPLSISWVAGMCSNGYGDIAVWQENGHSYVAQSGFSLRMYHLWNVDDPYHPILIRSEPFPAGGSTSTTIFDWTQNGNYYMSVGMRGSGTGCGVFVYNVNDPANPSLVNRAYGTDWCTPHEHFVSTDANGNADYMWVSMSGESGSGYKVVALDLSNLPAMPETGRYQRSDSGSNNFVHDVTVIGNRVFLSHWGGGLIIQDKNALAHNINPTPLNPIDSIRPSNFWVHHSWPTSDGNHVFVEDEFLNASNAEKIKMYNISDISAPYYETGIIGPGIAGTSQAHNLKILNISPGHDLLFDGWYKAGTLGFDVDYTGSTPVITNTILHQLRQTAGPGFGNVWGVDYLPCTLHGEAATCVYSSDMTYGLVVDALGNHPNYDPYAPESSIGDPTNGQTINACQYTVRGAAHDYYSGVAQVQVSTDDGSTWNPASGTTGWTYDWSIPADGSYSLKVRATDNAGNVENPTTSVQVTVAGLCGGSVTPTPQPTDTPVPPTSTPQPPTATAVPATATVIVPTATPTTCSLSFSDVQASDYFYAAVRYLACNGAISGYSDGTFRPYAETTRGQLSKIVVLAEGFPIDLTGAPHFTDVTASNPFYAFIETADNRGLISGYTDGTFRWGGKITRAQLSKIIVLAEGWPINTSGGPHFSDVPASDTFYGFIETAYNHVLISGYADGTFRPDSNATRGQIARIVYGAVTAP